MGSKRQQTTEYYLLDTSVENMFINEYMPDAPGEYVKVYLFALMYADLGVDMNVRQMAKQLGSTEDEIMKAWDYWDNKGVIKRDFHGNTENYEPDIIFMNLKEKLYGKEEGVQKDSAEVTGRESDELTDKAIGEMFESIERIKGTALNGTEMQAITDWAKTFNATPEMIMFAYSYCKNLGKSNHNYIGAVIRNWVSKGLTDETSIRKYLEETDQRHYLYRRIFKALGFKLDRNPTEAERRIMDAWFDEMEYTIDTVLKACDTTVAISNPNIKYVDAVIRNWKKDGEEKAGEKDKVSANTVMRYYEYVQKEVQEAAERHKQEVFEKIPRIREIEEELTKLSKATSRLILTTGQGKNDRINAHKAKIENLVKEKTELLADNDFDIDYMETKHMCNLCKDTGINESGKRCGCFEERALEAALWAKNLK